MYVIYINYLIESKYVFITLAEDQLDRYADQGIAFFSCDVD